MTAAERALEQLITFPTPAPPYSMVEVTYWTLSLVQAIGAVMLEQAKARDAGWRMLSTSPGPEGPPMGPSEPTESSS